MIDNINTMTIHVAKKLAGTIEGALIECIIDLGLDPKEELANGMLNFSMNIQGNTTRYYHIENGKHRIIMEVTTKLTPVSDVARHTYRMEAKTRITKYTQVPYREHPYLEELNKIKDPVDKAKLRDGSWIPEEDNDR